MTGTRLAKGQARREFIANLEQINSLLEQKYPLRYVYDTLANEGKISMKYTVFTTICRRCSVKP